MKIGIAGCNGRVGTLLVQELQTPYWKSRGLELAGGMMRHIPAKKPDFFVTDTAKDLFSKSDAVIDFTLPEGTRTHLELAEKTGTKLIIGTTGLSAEDEAYMQKVARKTAIIYAANMSLGVNLLLALVEKTATLLGDEWDIEIFESHHKLKLDAPSGTALALGKAAATGRGHMLDELADYARHGHTGTRERGKIGFSVARGGDVIGDHTVFFLSEGERLELTHKATNRSLFARGALHATLWSKEKPPGLYTMRDVLGL